MYPSPHSQRTPRGSRRLERVWGLLWGCPRELPTIRGGQPAPFNRDFRPRLCGGGQRDGFACRDNQRARGVKGAGDFGIKEV